jgi:alkanesulfonate monooxygenase SsuD/methylene tetrahydromethanopterin reductase-like flavin-dependent oxidoreductase (luciferase family)
MEIGLAVAGNLQDVAALASRAEAAGIESVWLAELDRSALRAGRSAISATSRIGVGTAVALAFPRSPTVTAMTAWDLDEMSGDRFMLGLRPAGQAGHGGPLLSASGEAGPADARVRAGRPNRLGRQPRRARGARRRGYRITMPTFHGPLRPERRDTPILMAAVGPVMSRVCGEVANGLLGPSARVAALPARSRSGRQIDAGLKRAGRPSDACPITAMALVSIGDDAAAARRAARLQIAFYATTPSYKPILEMHGRGALPRDLRRAFVNRDPDRMAELIDDELLDAIAVAGRPDEAPDRLRAWEGVADRVVLGVPWYGMDRILQSDAISAALDLGSRVTAARRDATAAT